METSKDLHKDTKSSPKKQQWAKTLSTHFAINLAMQNPDSPLKKSYDNSYHCARVKQYDGEKMTSTYCKNRWCYTCNRIRTAININNYAPEISKMGQPYFVTLTRPTVKIEELPEQIKRIENDWRLIYNYSKKTSSKKKGIFLSGIRSMECTIRPGGFYHYHFHIIVDGWANAEWLHSEWLKRNPESRASGQNVKPANKGAMLELFKYAVKMSVGNIEETNFKRLDKVFQVLKGKRTLSTFGGFKIPKTAKEDEFEEIESQITKELQLRLGNDESVWVWDDKTYDWVDKETGELLIGEPIPDKILKIVEKK